MAAVQQLCDQPVKYNINLSLAPVLVLKEATLQVKGEDPDLAMVVTNSYTRGQVYLYLLELSVYH